MRLLLSVLAILAAAVCFGQAAEEQSLFRTLRPDGTIVVRQHQLGPQIVEITMQDPKYPADLLQKQVQDLADGLHSTVRGLQVFHYKLWAEDPNPPLVKATFGVEGLEDPSQHLYRLEPIVRAFAGAPEPYTVHGLSIQFERQVPGRNTLRKYRSKSIVVEASEQVDPNIGVEYRVRYLSQNPQDIVVPDAPVKAQPKERAIPTVAPDLILYGLIVIAALALGALVYSLLLRVRPPSTPRTR